MRPMANNREAMADLQSILRTREPLYGKADAELETSSQTVEVTLDNLVRILPVAQVDV